MSLNIPEHGWILPNVPEFLNLNCYDYAMALNMPMPHHLRYMPGFWICRDSEYGTFTYGLMSRKNHEFSKMSEYYWINRLANIIWHLFVTFLHCQIRKINYSLMAKRKFNAQNTISKKKHSKYRDTLVRTCLFYDYG